MKRKIIASVILLIAATFLVWYMYKEYKEYTKIPLLPVIIEQTNNVD